MVIVQNKIEKFLEVELEAFFSEFIGSILYFLKFRKLLWQVDKLWNSMNMELNGVWKVTNREKREHIILEHKKETKFEKLH